MAPVSTSHQEIALQAKHGRLPTGKGKCLRAPAANGQAANGNNGSLAKVNNGGLATNAGMDLSGVAARTSTDVQASRCADVR